MRSRWTAAIMAATLVLVMAGTAMAAEAEESSESTELSDAQMMRASQLAWSFAPAEEGEDPSDEDVEALTETIVSLRSGDDGSVGWGVLYKLLLLAEFNDTGLSDYMDSFDGNGWGLGKLMKAARDADPEWTGDKPKNLGQWKKQQKQSDG